MKRLITVVIMLLTGLLCGCSPTRGKILVISEFKDSTFYLYDSEYNYYACPLLGEVIPISKTGSNKPMILCIPSEGEFTLKYISTGRYTGTFTDFSSYVNRLISTGYIGQETESNYAYTDIELNSTDTSVRLIYNSDGTIHVFSVNHDNVGIRPPYTCEDTLDIKGSNPVYTKPTEMIEDK